MVSMKRMILESPKSSRSFRRYRDQGRGSLHSCAKGLLRHGSVVCITKADGRKRLRTQLGKDVPEPVKNKHRGDGVGVGWTEEMSVVRWMSCPAGGRSRSTATWTRIPKSPSKIAKKSNKLCGEGLTLIYLHKRRYPSS